MTLSSSSYVAVERDRIARSYPRGSVEVDLDRDICTAHSMNQRQPLREEHHAKRIDLQGPCS
jgi:hypothetical protein